jgi:hypothetical protein
MKGFMIKTFDQKIDYLFFHLKTKMGVGERSSRILLVDNHVKTGCGYQLFQNKHDRLKVKNIKS